MHKFLVSFGLLVAACSLGCKPPANGPGSNGKPGAPETTKKPTVAYVTNGIASFWEVAEAGCKAAERDFDCNVIVKMPTTEGGAVANQKRILEELITTEVDGIAVSPIDPDNQTDILNTVAEHTRLITHDSDAPGSKRIAYIGMNNYAAGRLCGKLVKEALPEGGELMIFVGRLEQLNARLRRQGLIDELLDRSEDDKRYDEPGQVIKNDKYTILGTLTDGFDNSRAKQLAEETIAAHPNIACMVGLFAYNPTFILEAIKGADKLDKIKVVGFDEEETTLRAIVDGHCYGTVVQNPYMYGYESVRLLVALTRGDSSAMPEGGIKHIDARQITRKNVDEFWTELKKLTSGKKTPADDKPAAVGKPASPKPPVQLAFVTNNASEFWKLAEAGVRKAEPEFNAQCEVRLPPQGTADDQQQIIEALIAKGVAGMAISPNDAENQVDIINKAAEHMAVITHDSDAPKSNRAAYVGTNNYKAGREAGKLIKEVVSKGGKIMLFVGRTDAQNAIDRSNGIKDELKDSGIEILGIRTDQTERARAKQNVEDTLTAHPDIACLVGLWSYNGPQIVEAVKDASVAGKVPVVCFDEEDGTLQGVQDGIVHATVVQQPFQFGYESVRILAAMVRGEPTGVPENKVVDVPVKVVRKADVKEFWDNLKKIKSGKG